MSRIRPSRPFTSRLLSAAGILVLVFLMAPILLVIPMSFGSSDYLEFPPRGFSLRWYAAYFGDPDWTGPTILSLEVAALTAILAAGLGTAASLAIVRSRLARSELLNAIVAAPMITPAIIVAIALYLLLARLGLTGTLGGFVLAHAILTLPLVIFSVSSTLRGIDRSLEQAAMGLGATGGRAVLRITLAICRPSILIGSAFAFITSFDEATVAFFISTADGKTLPKKMFESIEWELSPVTAAVSTMLVVLSLGLVLVLALSRRSAPRP